MPGTQNTFTGPLFYGTEILVSVLVTGFFLWLTINVGRRFPPFTGVLLTFCCLTGSAIPIALVQIIIPPLDSLLGTLTPSLMFVSAGLIGTVRLTRARYREETQSLGFLLFGVIVGLLVILLVQVLPHIGYRDALAFGTAGTLVWAIGIIPHWFLRDTLLRYFTRHAQPATPLPFGRALLAAVGCALLALCGLTILWRDGHLGLLIPSLPNVGALCAWLLVMDAYTSWVRVARPLPAYPVTAAQGTSAVTPP